MLPAWIALGALAGAAADWIAARLTESAPTRTSLAVSATAGVILTAIVLVHPLHGWHGRLLPFWLWGWLVAANADLRAQKLYDYHTVGLLALALVAGIADHRPFLSVAGAVAMGGLWLIVRGGLRWWTRRTSVALVGVSVIVLLVALRDIALARHALAVGGSLVIVERGARDLVASLRTATLAGFGIVVAPLLAWIGAITRRALDGEDAAGGADVLLWAAAGAWFGLRWVWPVALLAVVALALAAIAQIAARKMGWRVPWAADYIPVVPILLVALATAS